MKMLVLLVVAFGTTPAATPVEGQGVGRGADLDELLANLRADDPAVRLKALHQVGSMRPHAVEIAPHVIRRLEDPEFKNRAAAANVLGNLQNALPDLGTRFPECIPRLILMLSEHDPADLHQQVRRNAAYALQHLGPPAKAAVPSLLEIAVDADENANLRGEAVQALGGIGLGSPEVVAALTKLLDDPTRIEQSLNIGSMAGYSLGKLGANAQATQALIPRLRLPDPLHRMIAAAALGPAGYGSPDAEEALLELLEDPNDRVQRAALASLEGINDTYAFFFRHNFASREVEERRLALLREIRDDAVRKASLAKILAARVRLAERNSPGRADSLQFLAKLDARDYTPMLKEQFARLEKKVVAMEWRDLRLQLLITLAAWLPDGEVVPFLIGVDSDPDEAPMARFRAAILLCERGDARSVAHIVDRHAAKAGEADSLVTVEMLRKALKDHELSHAGQDSELVKEVDLEELAAIRRGVQLAQHLYDSQQRGPIRGVSPVEIRADRGEIESIKFRLTSEWEGWIFELRKQRNLWLPTLFRMEYIR